MSLLVLAMIVKNEAPGIRATLESGRPFVDAWVIIDTGSTDGTQGIVEATMRGVPGELYHDVGAPFRFDAARNAALELAFDTGCKYALTLSAGEIVEGDPRWIPQSGVRAFDVVIKQGDLTYRDPRILHRDAGYRYVGATHEYLDTAGYTPPLLLGIAINHVEGKRRERLELDREILTREVEADPKNARAWYYLGQTFQCLGQLICAETAFAERIKLGGWREEVFEALLRRAQVSPDTSTEDRLFEAYSHSPHRAEPLFELAQRYYGRDWARCFLFSSAAAAMPFPNEDRLFIRHEIYSWRAADMAAVAAWNLGRFREGHNYALRALVACPDDPRLQANVQHFEGAGA